MCAHNYACILYHGQVLGQNVLSCIRILKYHMHMKKKIMRTHACIVKIYECFGKKGSYFFRGGGGKYRPRMKPIETYKWAD